MNMVTKARTDMWRRFAVPEGRYDRFDDLPKDAQDFLRLRGAAGVDSGELPECFGPIITSYVLGEIKDLDSYAYRARGRVIGEMSLSIDDELDRVFFGCSGGHARE